jgi:hypothetical protein
MKDTYKVLAYEELVDNIGERIELIKVFLYQNFDTDTGTPADAVLHALDEISKLCEKRGI